VSLTSPHPAFCPLFFVFRKQKLKQSWVFCKTGTTTNEGSWQRWTASG
jgi:hypothetical protein